MKLQGLVYLFVLTLAGAWLSSRASDDARCGDNEVRCEGSCVDPLFDTEHCGACGVSCGEGELCAEGVCVPACPPEMISCSDGCVHPARDWRHCGGCDNACPAGEVCSAGECMAACPDGQEACERSCEAGDAPACFDLDNDPARCGSCTQACEQLTNSYPTCVDGSCGFVCEEGFGDCNNNRADGCETRLDTNDNCGACGWTCDCKDGVCRPQHRTVAAGEGIGLVVQPNGELIVWGDPWSWGESPIPGETITDVVAVDVSSSHAVALRSNGEVVVWGTEGLEPPPDLGPVEAVAAVARGHSYALRGGKVIGWGRGDFPYLEVPAGLDGVVSIASGQEHVVALRRNGTVVAWGNNLAGQIDVPTNLSDVRAIGAANYAGYAIRSDGSVVWWGASNARPPEDLRNVVAISGGFFGGVALLADGNLRSWGNQIAPGGLDDVVAISANIHSRLALRTDGSLVAWGERGGPPLRPFETPPGLVARVPGPPDLCPTHPEVDFHLCAPH